MQKLFFSFVAGIVCLMQVTPAHGFYDLGTWLQTSIVLAESPKEQTLYAAINDVRAVHGLPAVEVSIDLEAVAKAHSQQMLDEDFFAHDAPNGEDVTDRMDAAGITYTYYGENLAAGQTSVTQVIDEWMASSGHREVLLGNKYDTVGVGIAHADQTEEYPGLYWTLIFTRSA